MDIHKQVDSTFYKNLLETLDEAVYYVDSSRQILFWNNKAEEMTGYLKSDVINARCHHNILNHVDENGKNMCVHQCPLLMAIQSEEQQNSSLYLHHKNGHRIPVSIRSMPIKNAEGMILGAVEMFSSNARKETDESKIKELARLAYLDNESNLPNKNYMEMKWESIHSELVSNGLEYGVLFLRIANYDHIMNQMEYTTSVKVITSVSKTMHSIGHDQHVIGRWNDTDFLVLMPSANFDNTENFAKRYARITGQSTFDHNGKTARIQTEVKYYFPDAKQSWNSVRNAAVSQHFMKL